MTACAACIAERRPLAEPCPHEALAAVHRYAREQFLAGLRAGFEELLSVAALLTEEEVGGPRRRSLPVSLLRSTLRARAGNIVHLAQSANFDVEAWQAEARAALDVPSGT